MRNCESDKSKQKQKQTEKHACVCLHVYLFIYSLKIFQLSILPFFTFTVIGKTRKIFYKRIL